MTDVNYTQRGVVRSAAPDAVPNKGDGRNLMIVSTYRNPGALVVASTIFFGRFDSNSRLHGSSAFQNTANAASTTLALGLASVNNNFGAPVPAALMAATSIAAAARTPIPGPANAGKMLWEIAGLASDPGGQIDVYGTTGGATLNASSDNVLELHITVD